jgi:hypothetical protein
MLYDYVKDILSKTDNLKAVYIGKTSNPDNAEKRHREKYCNTQVVAIGPPDAISQCEDYLIQNLKKDLACTVEVDNKNAGSAGNPNANMLYVSWDVKYESIDQLDSPDFDLEPYELIKE